MLNLLKEVIGIIGLVGTLAAAFPAGVAAAPGDLDPTFGTGGKVVTDVGGTGAGEALAVARQTDGKVVVAGTAGNPDGGVDWALVRYNADGSLDSGFGTGGVVFTSFESSGSFEGASDVVIQPDGKILAVGAGPRDIVDEVIVALARYNTDGTLDTTFGALGSGMQTRFFIDCFDFSLSRKLALQPDGKIVVTSRCIGGDFTTPDRFAVGRFNANGLADTSFGDDGLAVFGVGTAQAVAIQPDGKIVVAGAGGVVRFNANGTPDTGFGSGGQVGLADDLRAVALQADGKIVAIGGASIVRLNANGSLDSSFGGGGVGTTPITAHAGALQPDGKIIAAGFATVVQPDSSSSDDFALARHNADGSLDSSFGSGGLVTTHFNGASAVNGIALHPDGKVIAAGTDIAILPDGESTIRTFALARYLGGDLPGDTDPVQLIVNLIESIRGSALPPGLASRLRAALAIFLRNPQNVRPACNGVDGVIRLVQLRADQERLSPDQAAQLIGDALAVKSALGC